MDGYISEIRYWGPTWVPRNWSSCEGQLISISTNQALFSLIGTIYGGDGRTTFALPDLRGRVAVGAGSGTGLTPRSNGQFGGSETVPLSTLEIPSHNHYAQTLLSSAQLQIANTGQGTTGTPAQGLFPGVASDLNGDAVNIYANTGTAINSAVSGTAITNIQNTGGSVPHQNQQPYQVLTPIICMIGIYPSRS